MTDDATLLRLHATGQSQAAFAEFVQRHMPLVYSAAVRRLGGDTHRAEDVAQVVFCAVARKADKLSEHAVLTGWLYTATRNAVADTVRAEQRRRAREEAVGVTLLTTADSDPTVDWSRLRPILDGAMDELSEADRDAVLLRYFQGRSFAEIGASLGTSDDTARKRVERALDKLRDLLAGRKIVSTSAALATVLAAETALATPAGLVATVTGAALASASGAATGAAFFALTKLQAGLAAAVIVAGTAGLVVQQQTNSTLRETTAATEQRIAALTTVNANLVRTRAALEADVARLREEKTTLEQTLATPPRPVVTTAPASSVQPGAIVSTVAAPAVDTPSSLPPIAVSREQSYTWHRRFDPFVRQYGLTPAQADRLIELWYLRENARADLQAAVEAKGLRGDANGIEALRRKLYAPITAEVRALLGPDVQAAYGKADGTSYYRMSYVEPLLPRFVQAQVALSEAQIGQLIEIVRVNDRPVRVKSTDITTLTQIDWNTVAAQSGGVLTPEQLLILRAYAAGNPR